MALDNFQSVCDLSNICIFIISSIFWIATHLQKFICFDTLCFPQCSLSWLCFMSYPNIASSLYFIKLSIIYLWFYKWFFFISIFVKTSSLHSASFCRFSSLCCPNSTLLLWGNIHYLLPRKMIAIQRSFSCFYRCHYVSQHLFRLWKTVFSVTNGFRMCSVRCSVIC